MGYLAKRKTEDRERIVLYVLLAALVIMTFIGTLVTGVDGDFDYIGEFKVQAAISGGVLAVFCLYRRSLITAGVFFLIGLINLVLIASHYHFSAPESTFPKEAPTFTFLYQDLKDAGKKADVLETLLQTYDADLVLLTNVPVAVYEQLNIIKGDYVLQNQTQDVHGKMMLILARTPGTARGFVDDAGIWVSRIFGERKLTVVLTSLGDVWNGEYAGALEKVEVLSRFAQARDEPVLLIGDLKATNWSRLTDALKTTGELEGKEPLTLSYPADVVSFFRRPTASVYAHRGVDVVDIYSLSDMGTAVAGIYATVKMAPVKKEVVFYDLQPTVAEEALLPSSAAP